MTPIQKKNVMKKLLGRKDGIYRMSCLGWSFQGFFPVSIMGKEREKRSHAGFSQ